MKALALTRTSIYIALAVTLRYMKNTFTTIQFINIPLIFTILAGIHLGYIPGFIVGIFSYLISDLLIFPGLWTVVDSFLAGIIGAMWGIMYRVKMSKVELFILVFLSILLYDILSSSILYMLFGLSPFQAFTLGILGLFIPVYGGGMIGVGPLTEGISAFFLNLIVYELERRGIVYG